jgi:2-dehydropantoate 2-reductase
LLSSSPSIAVVGAGAVGCFHGALLARAGHRVTLIGRPSHVEAVTRDGLRLEMGGATHTAHADASADIAAAAAADIVLFCVKSPDTDAVARQLAPHLSAGALVMSLQNGVDNAATIARHVRVPVIPAVVYVATAMSAPGTVRHFGRGELVIGALDARAGGMPAPRATLDALAALFSAASIPTTVSDDVQAALWSKLLVNCAYNALSALGRAPYARIRAMAPLRDLQQTIVDEVIAVARADGVTLPREASLTAVQRIAETMADQLSSTAQDMMRGKPSEIDHLNGFVARRGAELGVATPVNQTLHALVKLVEAGYPTP